MSRGPLHQMIFALQGGRCFYCEVAFIGPAHPGKRRPRDAWTRDHVHPASAGGKKERNMVFACLACNEDKGARLPTEHEINKAAVLHDHAVALFLAMNGPKASLGGWKPTTVREEALSA